MMADPNAPNDKPLGVANIHMCVRASWRHCYRTALLKS